MARQIPTTSETYAAILANFESAFGYPVRLFARAFLRVLAKVLAGLITVLYRYGNFFFLQQFVQYASSEPITVGGKTFTPLLMWGELVGAEGRAAGTRAIYTFRIKVNTAAGVLGKNTAIKSLTGALYLTLVDTAIAGDYIDVDAVAVDDPEGNRGYGDAGNLDIGARAQLVNAHPNLATRAAVLAEVVHGVDPETWEAYRQRVIDLFNKAPQGGAYVDYEVWAETVVGIINAYVYRGDPGVVEVYLEATPESCGNDDGIPTAGQLSDVYDAIQYVNGTGKASRRPVCSYVDTLPISRAAFDVTIFGFTVEEKEVEVKDRISAALSAYFASREPYIPGLTVGPRRNHVTISGVAGVIQDILDAYNGYYTTAILYRGGEQKIAEILGRGEKAKLGSISYD